MSLLFLGRHWSLEEAFQKINELSALERKKVEDNDEAAGKPTRAKQDSLEDQSVWCSQCLDDQRILICCFCGCKVSYCSPPPTSLSLNCSSLTCSRQVCFGKHNPGDLLRCDGCDSEYHTSCLTPPLEKPPDGAWFCHLCSSNPHLQRSVLSEMERQKSLNATSSDGGAPKRRGRGRPPGSARAPKQTSKEIERELQKESSDGEGRSTQPPVLPGSRFSSASSTDPTPRGLVAEPPSPSSQAEIPMKREQKNAPNETVDQQDSIRSSGTSLKRRQSFSSSATLPQNNQIFSPMTLENTLQSLQFLLDSGSSSKVNQLSLRETARVDVAMTQVNIFKEWAPAEDLKKLLEELLLCRTDILDRLSCLLTSLHHSLPRIE